MKITTINPATEKIIKSYSLFSRKKLNSILVNSEKAFQKWKELTVAERCSRIKKVSNRLLKNKTKYANTITQEMGKPIKESIAEIEKCAWLCDYYAKNAEKFLEEEKVKTEHKYSYIRFEPLGKILCIMPWNFPFWQVLRFAIPSLCAGNTIILKHSSVTIGCALHIENLFKECLEQDVFQNVITNSKGINYLIDKIEGVSLTGSVETGRTVAQNSGKKLKKFVLELGGSDAFIVLKDAEIKLACEQAVRGRLINSGQSCIAAKRFIVVENKFKEFSEKIVEIVKKLKIGNPLEESTQIGPLARKDLLIELNKQIKDSIKEGAKLLYGGKSLKTNGYFYIPTVLIAKSNMKVTKEETFGPVFSIIKVKNNEEAIKEANNSEFGLGASIWTKNIKDGMNYAKKIEAGIVFVNGIVKSDPRLPFGGIKNSGIGRELGKYGLLEFCNIKSVVVD